MGQPRRVPWATKGELYELYDCLFSPISDSASRKRGLARLNVYISSPSCPAFLFLLHNLLSAALLPPPSTSSEAESARLTAAMAIVRFVNGLVDPLQTGPYARPISHIAASLNIPPHLISLRHRATHEDLPSLPVLSGAERECIEYLHHYSFLPLLAESSGAAGMPGGGVAESREEELVKGWKKVMKQRLRERDVREDSLLGRELGRMKVEVERMVSRGEEGEIIMALGGGEGLVPTAKTKRSSPDSTSPPEASIRIWQPFLVTLCELQPQAGEMLAWHLLSLLSVQEAPSKEMGSSSWRWTAATWFLWICQSADSGIRLSSSVKQDLWRRIAQGLMDGDQILRKLAKTLAAIDESLASSYETLHNLLPPSENGVEVHLDAQDSSATRQEHEGEVESEVKKLEDRMLQFENALASKRSSVPAAPPGTTLETTGEAGISIDIDEPEECGVLGWRRLRGSEWTPRPVGIFA